MHTMSGDCEANASISALEIIRIEFQVLDEAGFNQVVKSYYSIRLTGILQEYKARN